MNNCQTFSDVLFIEDITKDIFYSSPYHKHVCQCDPKILVLLIICSLYFFAIISSNLLIYNASRSILELIWVHTIYENTKTRSVHCVYTSSLQSPECRVSSSCMTINVFIVLFVTRQVISNPRPTKVPYTESTFCTECLEPIQDTLQMN